MRILLIEDDKLFGNDIVRFLKSASYEIDWAENLKTAFEKCKSTYYNCYLVDISLPDGNGKDFIKQIKDKDKSSSIIVISAKDSIEDKVTALDLGADDYIAKPFHLAEFNARINAVLRRKSPTGNGSIVCNEITINPESHSVFVNDEEVVFTQKEFQLLLFLITNKNRVLSKNAIADHLWGDNCDYHANHDFLYSHFKNIRKKLTEKGCNDYIQTIYGSGYIFKDNETTK